MAITRIWQSGVEVGDLTEFTGTAGTAPTVTTTGTKSGTYKMLAWQNGASQAYITVTATRQFRIGLFWNPNGANPGGECDIVAVKNATPTQLLSVQAIGNGATNNMYIDVSGINQDTEVGAAAGSQYMHLGIDIKIHSSSGWVVVYKDGVEIMRFTGNTGNSDVTTIFFGTSGNVGGGNQWLFDDMYVDDTTDEAAATIVPIKRFQYTGANGNGNYSQFAGSDGNSTDNYALVDEFPHNSDTDYVVASGVDILDSYATAGYTLAANEACVAVIPLAICKRTGTTEQIALGTRTDSDSVGSDQTPGAGYASKWERQTTKPGGGSWDQAAITALEVLIKSRGTY